MRRFRSLRLLAVAATALTAVLGGNVDVAARVDPGAPSPVVIGDTSGRNFEVAHNPERNEFFAVWIDFDGFVDRGARGQRLDADGAPLGASFVVAEQRTSASGTELLGNFGPPRVAYNAVTDQYAVTFLRDGTGPTVAPTDRRQAEMFGQLVSDQGVLVGSEVSLNAPLGDFTFCMPRYPSIVADPSTGGYKLAYLRLYGTLSAGGECGGLGAPESVTVVQSLSGSLARGSTVDFPVKNLEGGGVPEIAHNPVTNQFMVTQPYSGRVATGADNRNGRRFPAQLYTSALATVGDVNVIDVDAIEPAGSGPVNRSIPIADSSSGNWFVVSGARFLGANWTNLLSPTGESLRTGTHFSEGTLRSADAVGDGTFVFSTISGKVVEVRADGTMIHRASPIPGSIYENNAIAIGVGGSGVGIGIGTANIVSYGFTTAEPGSLPLPPARLLDTRNGADFTTIDGDFQGGGTTTGGQFVTLDAAGRGGVPADAEAVLLNIAAAGAPTSGFVTAYPCDAATRPTTSNLNYSAGAAASAAAIAKLSTDGKVCLFTSATAHLIVDVNGFVPAGGSVESVVPARLLETRSGGSTVDGISQAIGTRKRQEVTRLNVTGRGGVSDDADAVLVNVTAIKPSTSAFLTVYPCDAARPTAANLNASATGVVNNLVTAKVAADGTICVYTSAATDLVVDVAAYVPADGGLFSIVPARLLETRSGTGNVTVDGKQEGEGRIAADAVVTLDAAGRGGVDSDASGVMLNVAYIGPTAGGFMTAYPCDQDRPTAANLNFGAGDVGSNAVFVKLSATGSVCIYSTSASDLAVDVVGYTVDS